MRFDYDVIVVGGGHAGCEAAAAAANMGMSTLLITIDIAKMAQMSCNPAVGGIAKGQIVREIDALGGYTGIVTDKTTLQFRMLNRSKGPAMWSPRAQCDKVMFSIEWRNILESIPNLFLWQGMAVKLLIESGEVTGLVTDLGVVYKAKSIVLTTGTFMNGRMFVGEESIEGGRSGDMASYGITPQLKALGFEVSRMKTGTPVRIDGRTIDFSKMTRQDGDAKPEKFSFLPTIPPVTDQLPCYITYTNPSAHAFLRQAFHRSPLFSGKITGIGPRYCPSIEDKLRTFSEKESHQLFVEPEGRTNSEYYLNGFSSSLPFEVQMAALHNIPGLENAQVYRSGYAVEYDYCPPTQLYHSLETKLCKGLFFAGQINGTTGYEEAAGQGLMAGINSALRVKGLDPFVLHRNEAYIGVLIDDLVTKGVDEPYRMFTSRAEYRILLRQDNADRRLTAKAYEIGTVQEDRLAYTLLKYSEVDRLVAFVRKTTVAPEAVNPLLVSMESSPIPQRKHIETILMRPNIGISDLVNVIEEFQTNVDLIPEELSKEEVLEAVEIEIKYSGYINREQQEADKNIRLENKRIPKQIDYSKILSVSTEGRMKLTKILPETIGEAARIPGISPSDIRALLIYLGR